jgi:hypothetical protein
VKRTGYENRKARGPFELRSRLRKNSLPLRNVSVDCPHGVRVASLLCDARPTVVLIKQTGDARSAFNTSVTITSSCADGARLTCVSSAASSTRPIRCTREISRGRDDCGTWHENLLTTITRTGGAIGREGYRERGYSKESFATDSRRTRAAARMRGQAWNFFRPRNHGSRFDAYSFCAVTFLLRRKPAW